MAQKTLRVVTVGTGALGSVYTSRLAASCHTTTVCRSNYDVASTNGIQINSPKFGSLLFKPDRVVRTISEAVSEDSYDYIIVGLKALSEVYNVAEMISPLVTKGKTAIVLIQNGLGVEECIVQKFPDNPLVSCVAYIAASQVNPGVIQMADVDNLLVGSYKGAHASSGEKCNEFSELVKSDYSVVKRVGDIEHFRWQKLFWNIAFSSLCTATRMTIDQILDKEETFNSVVDLMKEVIGAANAMNYEFDSEAEIEQMIKTTRAVVPGYKPSMLLDCENGNPMEVEAILGVPLRRAKEAGLQVPRLELLYSICSAINKLIINKKS
ncbi:2-dehydropantoate 2-reductase [Spinellus fusiger]|nr:2-dehydropantoate 2-reductase [Spinellus fusiger]